MEFRLWVFTQYGNVAVDLNQERFLQFAKALGVYRFVVRQFGSARTMPTVNRSGEKTLLISNREKAEIGRSLPGKVYFEPKYTVGERRYVTSHIRDAFTRTRVHKINKAGVGEPKT